MLTSEEKEILEEIVLYIDKKIKPVAKELDHTGEFPTAIIEQIGKMGLMGITVPQTNGGLGLSTLFYAQVIERVAMACASTAVIMSVNNSLVCDPLLKFGTEAQKKKFLFPLAQGEKLGCYALSEPGHGSDPAGLECQAQPVKDGFILKGSKNWITNGKEADIAIVFATTNRSLGHQGIGAFIVDTHLQGFHVSKVEQKLGIKASSTAQLFFDDVFIPHDCLLGKVGEGLKIALSTLDGGRIGIAAQALGIAQAAFECSVDFSKQRVQFGAPISKLQAIQFYIADMATRIQAARLLIADAACLKDAQKPFSKQAAMAKLFSSEAAMWVTTKAIQVHGGYGYTKEYNPERHFRDAKITEIYEGTSEIQRLVIASHCLKD